MVSHRIHGTHRISLRNFIYFFNQQIKLISQTSCPAQQNRLICVITLIFKTLSVKVCDVCVRKFFTQNPRKTQNFVPQLYLFFSQQIKLISQTSCPAHKSPRPFASLREEFHTELKVAVRTCEGKAIHEIHRKVSAYLHVSALRSVVVSRKVAKYRKVSATKICPYVLLYNKLINS
jgi:hypothetical protein